MAEPLRIVLLGQALATAPVIPETAEEIAFAEDLRAADAVFANLEASIAPDPPWPMKAKTVHATTPEAIRSLRQLGVTHVSLANNHAWDFGPAGVLATRDAAAEAGLVVAGAGRNLAEASAPAFTEPRTGRLAFLALDLGPAPDFAIATGGPTPRPGINALPVSHSLAAAPDDAKSLADIAGRTGAAARARFRGRVGYDAEPPPGHFDFLGIGIGPGEETREMFTPSAEHLARIGNDLRRAKSAADLVVVSLHTHHWAPDPAATPGWLAALCRRLAEAGADAVFCHGPPVVLGSERHGGATICHGLGNLVFHTSRPGRYAAAGLDVWRGMACEIAASGHGRGTAATFRAVSVGQPAPANGRATAPRWLDPAE